LNYGTGADLQLARPQKIGLDLSGFEWIGLNWTKKNKKKAPEKCNDAYKPGSTENHDAETTTKRRNKRKMRTRLLIYGGPVKPSQTSDLRTTPRQSRLAESSADSTLNFEPGTLNSSTPVKPSHSQSNRLGAFRAPPRDQAAFAESPRIQL
jgi:hypothetical protein